MRLQHRSHLGSARAFAPALPLTLLLTLGSTVAPAGAQSVAEVEPNDDFGAAQVLDLAAFGFEANPDIGLENGTETSTTIPHLTVLGTGGPTSDGTLDVYSVTVPAPVLAIFDIDGGTFRTWLQLYDGDENLFAENLGAPITAGAGGSLFEDDAFLQVVLPAAGTYFLQVGLLTESDVPEPIRDGESYTLHVSIASSPPMTADLVVTKSDGVETVMPGDVVTYTITIANDGPDDATGVHVTDPFPTALTGAVVGCAAAGGATCPPLAVVAEVEPNDTVAAPQDLESEAWSLSDAPWITDATTLPHVTVRGTGDGTFDLYAFTAPEGARVVADLDATAGFDGFLRLLDSGGAPVVTADDNAPDPGSNTATDPFLDHVLAAAGTYFLEVGAYLDGDVGQPPFADTEYLLHVSVEGHATSEPTLSGLDFTTDLPQGSSLAFTVSGTVAPDATGTLTNTVTAVADPVVFNDADGATATDSDVIGGGTVTEVPALGELGAIALAALLAAAAALRLRS